MRTTIITGEQACGKTTLMRMLIKGREAVLFSERALDASIGEAIHEDTEVLVIDECTLKSATREFIENPPYKVRDKELILIVQRGNISPIDSIVNDPEVFVFDLSATKQYPTKI
ncbi:MAG: hypothetical protein ACEQSL_09415 [Sediminibacterium sp.]